MAALVIKELKQLRRDVRTLAMVIGMPIIVMVLFGWGYGGGMGHIPIAVANLDLEGMLSWSFVNIVEQSKAFHVVAYVDSLEKAEDMVQEGQVLGAIVIPEGFTQSYLVDGAFVILVTDESMPSISRSLKDHTAALLTSADATLSAEVGVQGPRLSLILTTLYGPELKRIDSFMPVVLGMILLLLPATLISVAIAREREKGTFEALVMSPLRRWEIIVGKLLAYGFVTFLDLLLTLAIALYGFKVLMRCSLIDILAVSTLFLVGSLGLGLAASVVSRNQLQAYQISTFIFIPALLFCGAFAPVEILTPSSRIVAYINPLYYFVDALQSLMVRGQPLYMMLWDLTPLFIYVVVTLTCSLLLFKARVD